MRPPAPLHFLHTQQYAGERFAVSALPIRYLLDGAAEPLGKLGLRQAQREADAADFSGGGRFHFRSPSAVRTRADRHAARPADFTHVAFAIPSHAL